jgi:hypothetical protein
MIVLHSRGYTYRIMDLVDDYNCGYTAHKMIASQSDERTPESDDSTPQSEEYTPDPVIPVTRTLTSMIMTVIIRLYDDYPSIRSVYWSIQCNPTIRL